MSRSDHSSHQRLITEIYKLYDNNKPSSSDVYRLHEYRRIIENRVELLFKKLKLKDRDFHVLPTGSSQTNLAHRGADIDFVIWIFDKDREEWGYRNGDRMHERRSDDYSKEALSARILNYLREYSEEDFGTLKSNDFIPARIPLHRLVIEENNKQLDISVHISDRLPYAHSAAYFLQACCETNDDFAVLALIVKKWADGRKIKDSPNGYFNGYALVLMLLVYLVEIEGAIPDLLRLYPDRFGPHYDISELNFKRILPRRPGRISRFIIFQFHSFLLKEF
ncbi:hypothetical protein WR25_06542 isoform B [Diploscapter pachys]|uniref:Poly(A) RNA polymerase mitochondrial-like central palm domain-containing protein n=1 Tax=Diploscapter pachys TaxID=2018661 RepID=A0A2A2LVZ6_9BILA|nr:hypothetical protein WR25_06542 isoform B [Diploscapter pachys]